MHGALPSFARRVSGAIELRLKVIPGASREVIVGPLGDRLKIKVAAPPADGAANAAVLRLLVEWLGSVRLEMVSGLTRPEKTVMAFLDALPELPE
jgi:uncharacterized protein